MVISINSMSGPRPLLISTMGSSPSTTGSSSTTLGISLAIAGSKLSSVREVRKCLPLRFVPKGQPVLALLSSLAAMPLASATNIVRYVSSIITRR